MKKNRQNPKIFYKELECKRESAFAKICPRE